MFPTNCDYFVGKQRIICAAVCKFLNQHVNLTAFSDNTTSSQIKDHCDKILEIGFVGEKTTFGECLNKYPNFDAPMASLQFFTETLSSEFNDTEPHWGFV